MTQSAQSERAQTALKTSGITGAPLMSLERDDALFVLTDDMLVYQDGGGTRRVTLRDLTRIHSDQAGLLRVETPAGTALTASLLGFDQTLQQQFDPYAFVRSYYLENRQKAVYDGDVPPELTRSDDEADDFPAAASESDSSD